MKKSKFDLRFLYLYIPLVLLEIIFRLVQFHNIDIFTLIRVLLFELAFSVLVYFICTRFKNNKVYYIVSLIIIIWFCAYCFLELIFKNFMGDYYSFGTVSDGLGRIKQYAILFISNAKLPYYLCLLPIVIYILMNIFIKLPSKGLVQIPLIIGISSFLILIPCMNLGSGTTSNLHLYATFTNKDVLVDKLGMTHFFFRDITALGFKAPETINIETENIVEEPVVEDKKRVIDDTLWKNIMNSEENSNMATIDSYLMSKSITQPNDYTGKYEGKNFIYILVESGDYLMIDKDLTPTLYKMYQGGTTYYNHFTPLYSCATGESEFVSYTSIFPYTNTCTPNYVQYDYFYEALPWLFKNEGYTTIGFHNWRDEWYERNEILNHVGIDSYYDIDAIMAEDSSVSLINGWQSDLMLVEQAWKRIENIDGNYFAMIISSTMHFPYNEYSYLGDAYLDEVSAVHPDWSIDMQRYMSKSIEFNKAMEYLLSALEEAGQLEDTVICMYCDHRPYWLDYDEVIEETAWINDRSIYSNFGDSGSENIGIYKSPFLFYCAGDEKDVNYNYCSTLDHVPTIANLFNLNYDPRLYIGKDANSSSNTIIFTNGDWLNESGIYDASLEKFTPATGKEELSQEEIDEINKQVQNQINISTLILDEEYFEKRKDICYPNYE